MPRTIAAFDPVSRVRGLLVEVHAALADPSLELHAFERRLYERGVRVGLLVTPRVTLVVRDRVTGVQLADTNFDVRTLDTATLLATVGVVTPADDDDGLTRQTLKWLEAVAASWVTYVPRAAVATLVPDVVGELSELSRSDFEVWDDVLAGHDAVA